MAGMNRGMEKSRKKTNRLDRSRKLNGFLAVAGLVTAASLGICTIVAVWGFPAPIQAQIDIQPDKNARTGTLHAGEIQEVAAGDFWVVMNQLPTMEEGSRECNIEYENPSTNHYSARVSLYSKEDGKLLGNTRRVDPGNYVETIPLKKQQLPGEYPVTVMLELFEEKTPVGNLSIDITLRVLGEKQ